MLVDNFAKLSRPSRNTAIGTLAVIAIIAVYNWAVAPHARYLLAAQHYQSVTGNIDKEKMSIDNMIKNKSEKLKELQQRFEHLRGMFFGPDQAREFLAGLETLAAETNCIIDIINLEDNEPKLKNKNITDPARLLAKKAIISFIGTYENTVRLLEKLQFRAQKVWIDSLRMEALNDDSRQIKCDMTVTVYVINNKKELIDD